MRLTGYYHRYYRLVSSRQLITRGTSIPVHPISFFKHSPPFQFSFSHAFPYSIFSTPAATPASPYLPTKTVKWLSKGHHGSVGLGRPFTNFKVSHLIASLPLHRRGRDVQILWISRTVVLPLNANDTSGLVNSHCKTSRSAVVSRTVYK